MERCPEPEELMDTPEQALAYAQADFTEPNRLFVDQWIARFGSLSGTALDLGCGPADIPIQLAQACPNLAIHALDGAEAMLVLARQAVAKAGLIERIQLLLARLPASLPCPFYQAIFSNSLLHHLADPQALWNTLRGYAAPKAPLLVMDLRRPASDVIARAIVERYAAHEPELLRRDFLHSLRAAYTPEEVREQLNLAGLHQLTIELPSDRHLLVWGWACG